ncbi:uncharacterized protein [Miscanthus floridulus]|uniref:uncharacterized protein n=1 Tax=Miscanthus floridulus TaxID=154761 RepID=UPI0034582C8A
MECDRRWEDKRRFSMERMRRIARMGKTKVPSVVQAEDKDESVVFFRELYKREKYRDVNLLEPMYSVEFDAIQGGHVCRVPSGKRDFLIPVDEKHDYDWLMTPPAAPLFPSLDTEANSSRIVLQKELPIPPHPVKPSASRASRMEPQHRHDQLLIRLALHQKQPASKALRLSPKRRSNRALQNRDQATRSRRMGSRRQQLQLFQVPEPVVLVHRRNTRRGAMQAKPAAQTQARSREWQTKNSLSRHRRI